MTMFRVAIGHYVLVSLPLFSSPAQAQVSFSPELEDRLRDWTPPSLQELLEAAEPAPTLDDLLSQVDEIRIGSEDPEFERSQVALQELRVRLQAHRESLDLSAALGVAEEYALLIERTYGEDHPRAFDAWLQVGELDALMEVTGRSAQASADVLEAVRQLAESSRARREGDFGRAASNVARGLELLLRVFPEGNPAAGLALRTLAHAVKDLGEWVQARELYGRAVEIFLREDSMRQQRAEALADLGWCLFEESNYPAAELFQRSSLALSLELELSGAAARAMNELALTLIERGNLDASEKLLRRALEVRVDSGAILEEALLYKNLAGLQIKRADLEEAERLCRESLRIYRSLSPRPTAYEARALATLGFVLAEQGKARDALEAFRQASKLLKECLGSKHYAVVEIDRNILAVYRLLGRSREAERLLEDVIQRTPHALQDSHADVIQDLSSLGGFLLERGDYPGAVSYLRDGLGRLERRSGPLPSVEANLKQNLGVALLNWSTARQGAPAGADRVQMQDEALQLLKEALRLRRQLRGPAAAATLRDQLAVAFHALGRLAEAERMAKRSVAESIRLHGEDHDRVALPTVNLAGVQASLGKTQEAADSYSRARAILRRHPDSPRWVWVTALEGLASLEIERGDLDRAAGLLREALMLTEVLRWQAGRSVIDRARFSQERGNRELATVLAWVEVLRGQPDAALEALEQGRSRVQLDSLAKPIESRLISLHPMVKSQALTKGLDEAMSAFDRVLDAETTPQRLLDRNAVGSRRTQQQEKASAAREQLDRALRDWTESLRRLWPGTMPQKLKSLQEALEPGEKILYLSQAMEGVSLCLLGETGPGQAAIVAEGQQEVDQLLRLVGVVAEELQTRKTGRSGLHKLSLRPLALELFPDEVRLALVAARRVVVITDPAFEGIPFQLLLTCLPRGKGEEGEQTEPVGVSYGPDVVYAASGSVYLHCRERAAIKREQKISELSAVLLGDPVNSELKDSGPEVEHLSALLRRQGWSCVPLLREKATLVQLEEVVAGSRLLHFSSHGHQSTGGSPYLELTPSESKQGDPVPDHLTLTRLFGHWRGLLDRCELVTLAACESGRGEPLGDSVLSLPWGFFYAGADTVVASLWKVHDAATRLLMERFYQNLLGSFDKPRVVCGERYAAHRPMPKVRALREAKEWLRVRTSEENRLALETLRERSDGTRNQPDEETATLLVPTGSSFKDRYDFSHPYFWAAFVLIGNPD